MTNQELKGLLLALGISIVILVLGLIVGLLRSMLDTFGESEQLHGQQREPENAGRVSSGRNHLARTSDRDPVLGWDMWASERRANLIRLQQKGKTR